MKKVQVTVATVAAPLVAALAPAQRVRFGALDAALGRVPTATNIPYDGRFALVRLTYETLPGGYWYRGQPAWSHGCPTSEQNLMEIVQSLTSVTGHRQTTSRSSGSGRGVGCGRSSSRTKPTSWASTRASTG